MEILIIFALLLFTGGSILTKIFKIVPEGFSAVVLFLGKYSRTMNSGLNILIPFLENMEKVDVREQVMDIPTQEVITNDNVSCMIDGIVRFIVIDPYIAIYKVQRYQSQISAKSQTALRDIVGSTTLDDLLAKRAQIAGQIKTIVDDAAAQWGVDILSVEIQNIEIPADMKRAMAQQAEAERDRKARIIKASGEKEASLQLAEAARILSQADGALSLRTLQTLKEISADPSQKIVIALPNDLFNLNHSVIDKVKK